MTDLEKAARQALEALELRCSANSEEREPYGAITVLRQALEQPAQQEPVKACVSGQCPSKGECNNAQHCLYTRPQATATPLHGEPLTDEQISAIVREAAKGSAIRRDGSTSHRIARAIEAAHGIKGNA